MIADTLERLDVTGATITEKLFFSDETSYYHWLVSPRAARFQLVSYLRSFLDETYSAQEARNKERPQSVKLEKLAAAKLTTQCLLKFL